MSNAAAAPTPEASGHPHQRVAWLELFYDLSFVGVIAAVANRVHGDPSALRILGTIGLIVIAWVGWFNVTALSNLSHGVTHWARLGIFGAMAGMVVLAVGVDDLDHGSAWLFCIGYAAARTATWPIWAMVRHRAGLGQLRPAIYGPGMAVLWIASALVPSPARWAVWAALLALELAVSQLNPSRGAYDFDAGHMLERIGLFVMLILGEAVVLIGASLAPTRELPSWTAGGSGLCSCVHAGGWSTRPPSAAWKRSRGPHQDHAPSWISSAAANSRSSVAWSSSRPASGMPSVTPWLWTGTRPT